MSLCKTGDHRAVHELIELELPFVHRVAKHLGVPTDERDDVSQETFLIMLDRIEQFRGGRLRSWLYQIVANVAGRRFQRRQRRNRFHELFARSVSESPATPVDLFERSVALNTVSRILSEMSPRRREVLKLCELEGLSSPEVAVRLDCSCSTVRSTLRQARAQFARLARGTPSAQAEVLPRGVGRPVEGRCAHPDEVDVARALGDRRISPKGILEGFGGQRRRHSC